MKKHFKNFKKQSIAILLLLAIVITPLFAACSSGSMAYDEMENTAQPEIGDASGGVNYMPSDAIVSDKTEPEHNDIVERKIIRNVTIYGETKQYDSAMNAINASVAEYGGYVSESKVTGTNYNYKGYTSGRHAYLVIKIPAEKLDTFLSQVGDTLNVTSSHSSEQDVSEAYYSVEARLQTLNAERDSLLAMMSSLNASSDYDFWYTIQKRISEIEQQIAEYQAVIRTYDNKVTYSTVNLTIDEVVEYTPIEDEEPGFFERIKDAFVESWTDFGEFCMNAMVVFIYAIPTLLVVVGIPAIIVVIIIKSSKKKKKKKKNTSKEE